MNDCDICAGSGIIRLPVREKLNFYAEDNTMPRSLPIREYQCPECSPKIPMDKIEIVQVKEIFPTEYKENIEFEHYIKKDMALRIGAFLAEGNFITYTTREDNYHFKSVAITAKCGILSPRVVKAFEKKVKENQMVFASHIITEITNQINNWRSQFNDECISKDVACRFCLEVLNKYRNKEKP